MTLQTRACVIAILIVALCAPVWAKDTLLQEFENAFIRLSQQVSPSVVEISAESELADEERDRIEELFRQFGRPDGAPNMPRSSTGSGFLFDDNGYIVTNNHVVEDATRIVVELHDGTERDGELIAADRESDIAVVKIDPAGLDLQPVTLGNSDNLQVGQFAIALGSPRGFTGSLSFGHISGLGREQLNLPERGLRFQHFIQTDAAINLGNSGGPLCNIDGEVIGMNIAIVYGANSIGFAIPVNRIRKVVPQLIESGRVVRGWLGVSMMDIEFVATEEGQELADFVEAHELPDKRGAWVENTSEGGPARTAGILSEDVIRAINGQPIETATDLINIISDITPGDTATVRLWRKGEPVDLDIRIAEWPGEFTARYGEDILGIHTTEWDPPPAILENLGLEAAPSEFIVGAVVDGSPADEGGLRQNDIILEVAHTAVKTKEEFIQAIREHARSGKTLLLRVQRFTGPGEPQEENVYIKVPQNFSLN